MKDELREVLEELLASRERVVVTQQWWNGADDVRYFTGRIVGVEATRVRISFREGAQPRAIWPSDRRPVLRIHSAVAKRVGDQKVYREIYSHTDYVVGEYGVDPAETLKALFASV